MKALLIWLALLALPAFAHEVKLAEGQQSAAVLTLNYANGEPFAFEAYELYLPGKTVPEQVGRTSASGQIIFLAQGQTKWRVKAFSSDGHGIDREISIAAPSSALNPTPPDGSLPRWAMLLSGVAIVFGVFGLVQLFIRKRPS